MGALAEAAFQAAGQADSGLTVLVAKLVSRGQSLFPAILPVGFEQFDLLGMGFK